MDEEQVWKELRKADRRFQKVLPHVEAVFFYLERQWTERKLEDEVRRHDRSSNGQCKNDYSNPEYPAKLTAILRPCGLYHTANLLLLRWDQAVVQPVESKIQSLLKEYLSAERASSEQQQHPVVRDIMKMYLWQSAPPLSAVDETGLPHLWNPFKDRIIPWYLGELSAHCQSFLAGRRSDEMSTILQAILRLVKEERERQKGYFGQSASLFEVESAACYKQHLFDPLMGDIERLAGRLLSVERNVQIIHPQLLVIYETLSLQPTSILGLQSIISEGLKGRIKLFTGDDQVTGLLEWLGDSEVILKEAFGGKKEFVAIRDRVIRDYFEDGRMGATVAELLAKHTDQLIRGGCGDRVMDEVIKLLNYVTDKDIFQLWYARLLARRLVGGTLEAAEEGQDHAPSEYNREMEGRMIEKLRGVCRGNFATNLERMIADIDSSRELSISFHKMGEEKKVRLEFESTFNILSTAAWPISASEAASSTFKWPEALSQTKSEFEKFHVGKHKGKMLIFLPQLSSLELSACFGGKRRYTFTLSSWQYAVLDALWREHPLSTQALLECTGLPQDTLAAILEIFTQAKLVLASPQGWQLNHSWSSRKSHINFNLPLTPTQVEVSSTSNAAILLDRSTFLQATLVRLMKASRSCKHALLVAQTIEAVQGRFTPTVEDIDRAIEALIAREFLKYEDGGKSDTIVYLT